MPKVRFYNVIAQGSTQGLYKSLDYKMVSDPKNVVSKQKGMDYTGNDHFWVFFIYNLTFFHIIYPNKNV